MKKNLILLALAATTLSAQAGELKWSKDYAEATAQATASKKIILIDFYTDWCGWCKKLDKDTYSDARVQDRANAFVALKTNAEKEGKDLAAKYKVTGFPTILFIQPDGTEVGRLGGYEPAPDFLRLLKIIQSIPTELPELQKAVKTKGSSLGGVRGGAAAASYARYAVIRGAQGAPASEIGPLLSQATGAPDQLLAEAYAALGDAQSNDPASTETVGSYEKAASLTKDAGLKSYALASIVMATKDKAVAQKYAKQLIALPGATPAWVEIVKPTLEKK